MTDENKRAPGYKDYQKEIILNDQKVWVDPELMPLLKALNEVGLITRSHCSGHDNKESFVIIRLDNITGLDIRTRGEYNEFCIAWKRP